MSSYIPHSRIQKFFTSLVIMGLFWLLNFYVFYKFLSFFNLHFGLAIPFSIIMPSVFLLMKAGADYGQKKFLIRGYEIMTYWLGILVFSLLTLVVFEILEIIPFFRIPEYQPYFGISCLLIVITLAILSVIYFWTINIKELRFTSPKLSKSYKVVQIVDLQLGSINTFFAQHIIDKVQKLDPDFIVMPGDLFDTDYADEEYAKVLNSLQVPIFFTFGNHEWEIGEQKIKKILKSTKLQLLENEVINHAEFNILGIHDSRDHKQVDKQLSTMKWDKNKYSLLLYHRPRGLEDLEKHEIELMVTGHTHNGQIFPNSMIVNWIYKYNNGLYNIGESYLYNSPGTGLAGPKMRLGSRNEITLLNFTPGTSKHFGEVCNENLTI